MQKIQEYDRMKIAMLNVDLHKDDEEKKLYTTSRPPPRHFWPDFGPWRNI